MGREYEAIAGSVRQARPETDQFIETVSAGGTKFVVTAARARAAVILEGGGDYSWRPARPSVAVPSIGAYRAGDVLLVGPWTRLRLMVQADTVYVLHMSGGGRDESRRECDDPRPTGARDEEPAEQFGSPPFHSTEHDATRTNRRCKAGVTDRNTTSSMAHRLNNRLTSPEMFVRSAATDTKASAHSCTSRSGESARNTAKPRPTPSATGLDERLASSSVGHSLIGQRLHFAE
jgi:hypothetical protein